MVRNLTDVAGELLRHVEERHDEADAERKAGNTDVRRVVEQENAAYDRDDDVKHVADIVEDRHEHVRIAVCLFGVGEQRVVDLVKICFRLLLVAENLDDLLAVHQFLHEALGAAERLLLADEVARRVAADLPHNEEHEHDAEQDDERHPQAVVQHNAEDRDHGDRGNDELRHALGNHLAQRVDVVRVVAHDIAVVVRVEIADRQVLHAVEHFFTHLGERALRDHSHELRINDAGYKAQPVENSQNGDEAENIAGNARPVAGLPALLDRGDDVLHEDRGDGADDGIQENAQQRDGEKNRIKAEKHADQAEQNGFAAALFDIILHRCFHLPYSEKYRPRGKYRSTA